MEENWWQPVLQRDFTINHWTADCAFKVPPDPMKSQNAARCRAGCGLRRALRCTCVPLPETPLTECSQANPDRFPLTPCRPPLAAYTSTRLPDALQRMHTTSPQDVHTAQSRSASPRSLASLVSCGWSCSVKAKVTFWQEGVRRTHLSRWPQNPKVPVADDTKHFQSFNALFREFSFEPKPRWFHVVGLLSTVATAALKELMKHVKQSLIVCLRVAQNSVFCCSADIDTDRWSSEHDFLYFINSREHQCMDCGLISGCCLINQSFPSITAIASSALFGKQPLISRRFFPLSSISSFHCWRLKVLAFPLNLISVTKDSHREEQSDNLNKTRTLISLRDPEGRIVYKFHLQNFYKCFYCLIHWFIKRMSKLNWKNF